MNLSSATIQRFDEAARFSARAPWIEFESSLPPSVVHAELDALDTGDGISTADLFRVLGPIGGGMGLAVEESSPIVSPRPRCSDCGGPLKGDKARRTGRCTDCREQIVEATALELVELADRACASCDGKGYTIVRRHGDDERARCPCTKRPSARLAARPRRESIEDIEEREIALRDDEKPSLLDLMRQSTAAHNPRSRKWIPEDAPETAPEPPDAPPPPRAPALKTHSTRGGLFDTSSFGRPPEPTYEPIDEQAIRAELARLEQPPAQTTPAPEKPVSTTTTTMPPMTPKVSCPDRIRSFLGDQTEPVMSSDIRAELSEFTAGSISVALSYLVKRKEVEMFGEARPHSYRLVRVTETPSTPAPQEQKQPRVKVAIRARRAKMTIESVPDVTPAPDAAAPPLVMDAAPVPDAEDREWLDTLDEPSLVRTVALCIQELRRRKDLIDAELRKIDRALQQFGLVA